VPLTLAILKETARDESRVAATPDVVAKYIETGMAVTVQTSAGQAAAFGDDQYRRAGASIAETAANAVASADIVLCVQRPPDSTLKACKKGALVIGQIAPHNDAGLLKSLQDAGISAFATELMPRITRAQAMDTLSSQASLAGYRAVLEAAHQFSRAFPMMMTAAGTVPPAKVFVMGAGVAGLQAIATARRLGAVVSATDVRPAAKQDVQSLGASFVAVEDEEFQKAESQGGYAKEMSESYKKKQAELIEDTVNKQDIIITTALVPGKKAPELVTKEMVESMKDGAVIVDLAAPAGGNCAVTRPGSVTTHKGVSVIGYSNMASRIASDASKLYAKNLKNIIGLIHDTDNNALKIDWDDSIIAGIALSRDGEIIHPDYKDKTVKAKSSGSGSSSSSGKSKSNASSSGKSGTAKSGSSSAKSSSSKSTSKKSGTSSKSGSNQ
jgi:NAD(P) transhydrogenase subunit alpha